MTTNKTTKKNNVICGKSYSQLITDILIEMTTKQAFKQMITTPSAWKELGIPAARVLYFRNRIKNKKTVEIETMEKLLLKAGYKIVQEKCWCK